jgi:hypothetical protein
LKSNVICCGLFVLDSCKVSFAVYFFAPLHLSNTGHYEPSNVSDCFDAAKTQSPKLEEFKMWHFTSLLTPTHEIHANISCIAHDDKDIGNHCARKLLVKACIRAKVMNEKSPA